MVQTDILTMTRPEIVLLVREAFDEWNKSVCSRQLDKMEKIQESVNSLWWKLVLVVIGNGAVYGVISYLLIRSVDNVH